VVFSRKFKFIYSRSLNQTLADQFSKPLLTESNRNGLTSRLLF
jgi:hypothetical protein